MGSAGQGTRSPAARASWVSFVLILVCGAGCLLLQLVNQISPFELTRQGVLTGVAPRAALWALWTAALLSAVAGIGSLLLVRRADVTSKAITGIAARSLCGIAAGSLGTIVLWLIVGHVVIGF